VMTSVSGSDRKICELTLTLEDLHRVLKQYETLTVEPRDR